MFCGFGGFSYETGTSKSNSAGKEQGAIISFDPNVRLPLWSSEEDCKNTILEFAPYADILKVSDDELFFLTGQKDCEQVFTVFPNAAIILLTCGEQGSYLMTKEHRLYENPIPVKAIDTTGAGDAFAASFLYQLLRDGISRGRLPHLSKDTLEVYLRFSNAYAADSTTRHGAVHAMATTQEFHAFLQKFHISNVLYQIPKVRRKPIDYIYRKRSLWRICHGTNIVL
ncbi:MAG: PfkB family carbohydrate kinase [Acutalibacteraceae bacterium]